MINRERLAETFVTLCETDSPSRREGKVSALLQSVFSEFGPDDWLEDDSAVKTGSECGNLIFRFNGSLPGPNLFFNCHMDTVEPGVGVAVERSGDIFKAAGETILGSDDKSGIAALIEAMRVVKELAIPHVPVEFVFTTCEEIGLLGAKALDPSLIQAEIGYALDTSGIDKVVVGAPAANRIRITVSGVAAHAGLHPEWGVNAIVLAARAIAAFPGGRIDDESTVNFGVIQGGMASNIVAEKVMIEAEVRSHDPEKLDRLTKQVEKAFAEVIKDWQDPSGEARGVPTVTLKVDNDFPAMSLAMDSKVVQRVLKAAGTVNSALEFVRAGGGSDANIFNGQGLPTAIVATGMTHVHSTDEQVSLQDMVNLTRLILALLTEQQIAG